MGKFWAYGILFSGISFFLSLMKKLFALLAGITILVPTVAMASIIRANQNVNQTESLNENVYLTGPNPVMAGTVQGDLVAAGGNVYVSGTVYQDALVAGGTLNINGHIAGDLRAFGGNIMIDGPVDGELFVAGGTVTVGPHAIIRGDVNINAGQVQVDPAASMTSPKINIHSGEKDNKEAPKVLLFDTNKFLTATFWVAQLMLVLGMLVVVAIFHLLFPNVTQKFVQQVSTKGMFWKSFLIGLLILVVSPIAAIIAFITGIGGFLGALILFGYFALVIGSILYGGVAFGGLLYELIKKPKKYAMGWGWLILGVVGLHVVTWIPFVGWIVGFVFFLTAMGALATMKWKQAKT